MDAFAQSYLEKIFEADKHNIRVERESRLSPLPEIQSRQMRMISSFYWKVSGDRKWAISFLLFLEYKPREPTGKTFKIN